MGVTGTNGKTTSAFLLAHLLDKAGLRAGLMGTVERRVGGKSLPAGRTTPEALDIQQDLAEMVAAGDKAAVMEVSSHALDLGRTLGLQFKALAFTNLTQDHLDYHKTIDEYYAAKSRALLGRGLPDWAAVVGDQRRRQLRSGVGPSNCRETGCWASRPPVTWVPGGRRSLEWSEYSVQPGGTERHHGGAG